MRRHLNLVIIVTALLTLFPCILMALELSEKDNGTAVTVPLGEKLTVTIPGNPTTGYRWELEKSDRDILAADPEPAYRADSALIGAGGVYTFSFTPVKTGSGDIRLNYRRPWEKDTPPVRSYSVKVSVAPEQPRTVSASYRSDSGKVMKAVFSLSKERGEQVTVTLPDGAVMTLPGAMSASGARYSDEKETFWEHQGMGRFFRGETLLFEGKIQKGGQ